MRVLAVIVLVCAIADRAEAARCTLLLPLRVRADSLGFGARAQWPAGTEITYRPAKREWVAVESLKGGGYAAATELVRACPGATKVFAAVLTPPKLPASQPAASAPASTPSELPWPEVPPPSTQPIEAPTSAPTVRAPRPRARDEALRVNVSGTLPDPLVQIVKDTLEKLGPFRTTASPEDADYVVTGRLTEKDGATILALQLADVTKPFVDRDLTRTTAPNGLAAVTRVATKDLVFDVLERLAGSVHVTSSVDGATVRLDGVVVGVSPLMTFRASGGVHSVRVEREGYAAVEQTITVTQADVTELTIELEPLPETRALARRVEGQKRVFAWTFLATGAASVGTSGALFGLGSTLSLRTQDLRGIYTAAAITAALGVASLTVCLVLFLTGKDPLRF